MPFPACPAPAGTRPARLRPPFALLGIALSLGGCGSRQQEQAQLSDRECMARVMYFESNRSSDEGMLAVGTVVMNRVQSLKYPKSVCGVVGQTNQFAEGTLTKPLHEGRSYARATRVADDVLDGARHDGVGNAMFFHTAGYSFPYRNMRYVTLAGGNIFYQKQNPGPGQAWPSSTAFAQAHKAGSATMLASAERPPRGDATPARPPVVLASAERAPVARTPSAVKPVVLASAPIAVPPPSAAPRAASPASPRPAPIVLASARPADAKAATKPVSVVALAPRGVQGLNPGAVASGKASPIVLASVTTRIAPPPPKSVSSPAPAKPTKARILVATAEKAKPAPPAVGAKAKRIVVAMLADKGVRPPSRPRGRMLADNDD